MNQSRHQSQPTEADLRQAIQFSGAVIRALADHVTQDRPTGPLLLVAPMPGCGMQDSLSKAAEALGLSTSHPGVPIDTYQPMHPLLGELIERALSITTRPQLIIVDASSPDPQTFRSVMEALQHRPPLTFVVITTFTHSVDEVVDLLDGLSTNPADVPAPVRLPSIG